MKLRWSSLVAAAATVLAGAALAGRDVGTYAQWVRVVMAVSVAGGALVLLAVWTWREQRPGRRWLLAVLVVAVVTRLLVLPTTRELSDDAARYHWDGKALAHGINPFLYAPDDPAVAHLRVHAIDDRINHPWNRTCYPPLAQGLFAVGYRLSPGKLTGLQLLGLLGEILAWLLLARELARRERSLAWLLVLAWSPLIVFQGYLPGHVDVFNLPLVTLLILAVLAGHARRAGLLLALTCLIKPLPLLFLPAMAREFGARRTAQMLGVFAVVMALGYLPFAGAGSRLAESTWLMATDWSFNGSLGALFEEWWPKRTAHLVSVVLVGFGVLLTAWRGRDFLARALLAQVVFVALTPTLFPWYLVGMFPLLVLRPQPALLALGTLAPVADEVVIGYHATGVWRSAWWARVVQYVPFYGLLIWRNAGDRARRWLRHPVTLLAAAVLLLRLPLWLLPGPSRDEATYHFWAHHPEPAYAPLLAVLVRLAEWPLGSSLLSLRAPVIVLGALVLVLNDRRLRAASAPAGTRLIAALAVGLCPWQSFAGSVLHPDGLLLACLLALVLAAQRGRVLLLAGAAAAAVLAKPAGLLALPAAWWLAGRLESASRTRVALARAILAGAALVFVLSLDRSLLAGLGEFGRAGDTVLILTRVGAWGLQLVFLGGPLLLGLAVVGARERLRSMRVGGPGPARREAEASLALAAMLVIFFAAAAVTRGQFRANWILPAAVLLLPTGALTLRRSLVATGMVLAVACCLGQTLAMRQPRLLEPVEAALTPGGPQAFAVHAGRREARVSSARSWSEQLSDYAGRSDFARDVDRAWRSRSATASAPRWIVSDDYGLAMLLHWYLGHDAVRVVVPGDGMFHRTVEALLTADDPGPLLVLPMKRAASEAWSELEELEALSDVAHPVTGATLTVYSARRKSPQQGDRP